MSKKTEKKVVTLHLPISLVEEIDKYASQIGVSRTVAVMLLCSNQLEELKKD